MMGGIRTIRPRLNLGRWSLWRGPPSRALSTYALEMHRAWQRDPASVDASWAAYFASGAGAGEQGVGGEGMDMNVMSLVTGYQTRGHNVADLDPLGMQDADIAVGRMAHLWGAGSDIPAELELETYGYSEADLEREVELNDALMPGYLSSGRTTLGELVAKLKNTYCGTIGFEYMHLQKPEQLKWLRERIEQSPMYQYSPETQTLILDRLSQAHLFESFLQNKYPNEKRFGLDGCEVLIPGMMALIDRSAERGVQAVVLGMPHRGRLSVLANVLQKPCQSIFKEFAGQNETDEGSGDVKYHLGTSTDYRSLCGSDVHISLIANPSHLEAVNPLVEGKTRALQRKSAQQRGEQDERFSRAMSVILHGDAAFAGQGVVYETFGFSQTPSFTTGGTVHIVVNNQIGFTTDPRLSRSTAYCTDIGRAFGAPIFHVNGDDPEAVAFVCELAADWRQTFNEAVIIDIVCYRRHGHNEQDQPMFTQPKMYTHIAKHQCTKDIYGEKLTASGRVDPNHVQELDAKILARLESDFADAPNYDDKPKDWLESRWAGFKRRTQEGEQGVTGVDEEILRKVGLATTEMPAGFTLHKALVRILKARAKTVTDGEGIDFATAEAMAFGSLMLDGNHVRMSGQDVQRGTFSHRHAQLHDQVTEDTYVPLNHLSADQGEFTISNSHLSEYAVLGFELGYSQNRPDQLVLWEAQFGDFANTAQCIIDQFISSGEMKWLRQSGLVMLLPHGYEGMGPEHSSARLERFLQMSDDDPYFFPKINPGTGKQIQGTNWQIVNCSTAANYFHVLRRQLYRDFRKPLVCMTGKYTLRLREATSSIDEMSEGTRFQRVIGEGHGTAAEDDLLPASDIRRVVFCSGKVYYDLLRARKLNSIRDVALIRVEQLCPFPFDFVKEQLDLYAGAEVIWCQEEPKNQGGWQYVRPRIETASKGLGGTDAPRVAKYTGRSTAASTATGFK